MFFLLFYLKKPMQILNNKLLNKNKIKIIISFTISVFFVVGCAQVGSLSGGEKDKDPPVLLKSKPKMQALNFNDNKIVLFFDEYIVLDNLNSKFISSPPMKEKPEFKLKGKKLIIKFKEKLLDTTTYSFRFGDAIQDNNEKNPLKDFEFIFSTGNIIDTMEISGNLKDAFTGKPEEKMFVMLYREYNDSTPINKIPYYITKTDTSGNFSIDYMKYGKYKIFALKDLNFDYKFSLPNEKIAFLDSLISPKVKTKTKIDSLKAGTVIHRNNNDKIGDTLVNDTVIISQEVIYLTNNINLLSFEEDNAKQYIIDSKREMKGKCEFVFNKKPDSVIISKIDFPLIKNNYFVEKSDTGKSITYWLKEKEMFDKDSLKFSVSYFNKDSLENIVKETDTVIFSFNILKDTIKHYTEFNDLKTEQDSFLNYTIETNTPIYKIDSTKIKLFSILDTAVIDTKNQKLLNFYRPSPDSLFFSLKRPFLNNFFVEALNFDNTKSWYDKEYYKDTLLKCKITNENLYKKDTLKLVLHYDNNFFKNQNQKFTDTISMPLLKQGVISVRRESADTIQITFKKHISEDTELIINNDNNWYEKIKSKNKNTLNIKITKQALSDKDTLILTIKTKDYDNTSGKKIFYEYSKNAIFKFNKQKIKKATRPERNKLFFVMNKALINNFELKSLSFSINTKWYEKEICKTKDTVKITITDRFVSNMDTIKLELKYKTINRFNKNVEEKDTINLPYKKTRKRRGRRSAKQSTSTKESKTEQLQNVSIEVPVKYKILKDSMSERKYQINYPWISGRKYIIKIDSVAFTDIYENYSKTQETSFSIREKDYYSKMKFNLSNVLNISKANFFSKTKIDTTNLVQADTSKTHIVSSDTIKQEKFITDSIANSKLEKGQIIFELYNEKEELIKTKYTNSNIIFFIDNLVPGKYKVKLIYDENNNKKWDTGNYLKNKQPERVIFYSKEINLSSGIETIFDWDL